MTNPFFINTKRFDSFCREIKMLGRAIDIRQSHSNTYQRKKFRLNTYKFIVLEREKKVLKYFIGDTL